MHNIKRLLYIFSSILCLCCIFSSQAFAESKKFSTSDVEQFVTKAQVHISQVGQEQAFKDFMNPNDKRFRDGALYVFAFDYNAVCLAHIKAAMVGSNMMNLKDPNGTPILQGLIAAVKKDPNGGWTEYLWQNPVTNKVEKKLSYVLKINDDYWIGAGLYESEKK